MTNAHAYFSQTRFGDSRWWTWIVGFWMAVILWVVLGGILGAPIPGIVDGINPEAVEAYDQATGNHFANIDSIQVGLLSLLFMIVTVTGAIAWLIFYLNKGTLRMVFGVLSFLLIAASIVLMVLVYPAFNSPDMTNAFMAMMGETPIAYALMLLSFPAFLVGLFLVQKFIHKRTITSLHTGAAKINWQRIAFAVLITWAVLSIFSVLMHFTGISPLRATFDPQRFFIYALVTLIFIPLQSGTEEIIFRGYLNQGLGHFISNKWIVFIITSALFAAMHLSNPEAVSGAEEGTITHLLVMSQYFIFGFVLSVIVYFEGGLEAAIGVHAGNNMFAAMFINYEGSVLPTPSLFIAVPNPASGALVMIAVFVLIAAILYRTRKTIIPAPAPATGKLSDVFE